MFFKMMKKINILCLLFLAFFVTPLCAQTISGLEALLSFDNPKNFESVQEYDGSPIVYIHRPENVKREVFNPTPTSWRANIPTVKIPVSGLQTLEVPNVLHVPYLQFLITILSDKSAVVTERAFIVNPSKNMLPAWKKEFAQAAPKILYANHNGQNALADISENQAVFDSDGFWGEGVHRIEFSYTIENAVDSDGKIKLPLILDGLDYPAEHLNVVVNFPKWTPVLDSKILFGKNRLFVDGAVETQGNAENLLVLKMNGVLPFGTPVFLEVSVDNGIFTEKSFFSKLFDFLFKEMWLFILLLSSFVVCFYYRFAIRKVPSDLQEDGVSEKMMRKLSFAPDFLRWKIIKRLDARTIVALLLSLAGKGYIQIHDEKNTDCTLIKTSSDKKMTSAERKLMKIMFKKNKYILLSDLAKKIDLKSFAVLEKEVSFRNKAVMTKQYRLTGAVLSLLGFSFIIANTNSAVYIGVSGFVLWLSSWLGYTYLKTSLFFDKCYFELAEKYLAYFKRDDITDLKKYAYQEAMEWKISETIVRPIWFVSDEKDLDLKKLETKMGLILSDFMNKGDKK